MKTTITIDRTTAELRAQGCAVIVWTPEELKGTDPRDMEDRSIEYGYQVIETGDHEA